ncbi:MULTISPECIES: transposase [Lysobacter]|uniref:Transposase n=1 Tax=Lysobacter firmicutimachus TaxID=1792846 RepID=A0ABU8CXH3_9GAMM|nr:transposase [Lysobacter antibioticus]
MNKAITTEQCAEMVCDLDWQKISLALPPNLSTRAKNSSQKYRRFVEAVVWVACNRAFWSELPRAYGPWRSIYVRYMRWFKAGIWTKVDRTLDANSACGTALRSLLDDQLHAQQRRRLRVERKTPPSAVHPREDVPLL